MTSQHINLADYCSWLGPALAVVIGIALVGVWHLPAWVFMWALAFAIFAGFKWLTYCEARVGGLAASRLTRFLYLFCWPGMSLKEFAGTTDATQPADSLPDWIAAAVKTLIGAGLVWYAVPRIPADVCLVRGWVGMVGIILMLHFGTFHLLALALQACGFNARPNMQAPLLARSLADYYAFIGLSLICFGLGTFLLAEHLASGTPLARTVCGFLALFWSVRFVAGTFVFDLSPYRRTAGAARVWLRLTSCLSACRSFTAGSR